MVGASAYGRLRRMAHYWPVDLVTNKDQTERMNEDDVPIGRQCITNKQLDLYWLYQFGEIERGTTRESSAGSGQEGSLLLRGRCNGFL
ncbi:protein of unknown function [Paenibacillus alvei]|uniref:Uncharacterized protein n=1 Tax=Paenibacillus alvei TaxID=44250 RepID=A0A383RKJ1_PAEAL|nr:protein of unknown function [Paenibacillus alvei]